MVHLTEHEAFGIIRTRLEAAGLIFGATPPPGVVFDEIQAGDTFYGEADWHLRQVLGGVELDLYDAEKSVAVTYVNWLGSGRSFMPSERELAQRIEEIFAEQATGTITGAFYNPGTSNGWWERPTNDEVEELRPILVRQLINQADVFIAHLQSEGILEQFPDVDVIINGTPFNFTEYPVLINNQKMVPIHELFKALGMEITEDVNEWRIAITGTKNNNGVWVSVGLRSYNRGGSISVTRAENREWLDDVPVIMRNDVVLVPLQFVADFIGATIEWNEDTRTITITQD